jgi:site-specific DNA-cytosine methylase
MAVVSALRPRAFVFENVAGLTRVAFAGYLAQVKSDLAELGYRVESHVLDAAHYGVPQFRRRLFIVGLRSDLAGRLRWPYPTHSNPGRPMPGTLPWLTVRQALAGLEAEYVVDRAVSAATASKHPAMLLDEPAGAIRSGGDGHSHPHQYVAMSNGLGRADPVEPDEPARTVLARTSKDSHDLTGWVEAGRQVRRGQRKQGGPRKEDLILGLDEPAPAQFGLAQGRNNVPVAEGGKAWDTSQSQSQRLLDLDEPAFTISSMGNGKTGVRAPRMAGDDHESIHGVRYRRLNWRECAALQAFPPDWKFQGSDTDRYRQIGNALPPPLAQAVAAAVLAALVD